MSNTLERFAGHRYAPGYGRPDDPALADGFLAIGVGNEIWLALGAIGLLYVIIARGARRRTGMNAKMMRDLERAARQQTMRQVGTDLKLRYEAGENRDY